MPANLDPDAVLMLRVKQGDTAAITRMYSDTVGCLAVAIA
jgi:hypothetical protein